MKLKEKIRALSAKAIIIPVVVVLVIMHSLIIFNTININRTGNAMSKMMKDYSQYINDVMSLQIGSSILSETASTFVLKEQEMALEDYVAELKRDRRGSDVVEKMSGYGLGDDIILPLYQAAESASKMVNAQIHAIWLVSDVVSVPASVLDEMPRYELSAAETGYTDEEKRSTANDLVFGTEYTANKKSVSEEVALTVSNLRGESDMIAGKYMREIAVWRLLQWISTAAIIIILVITFLIIINYLVLPLIRYADLVENNDSLTESKGFYEMRALASAYNELREKRTTLESELRDVAETDALTMLPNRYSFNEYIKKIDETHSSGVFFLFDVNGLKEMNDCQGHLAGDNLIKVTSECIMKCFDDGSGKNCFRFGGDEFAAVLIPFDKECIEALIDKFKAEQRGYGISVAYGYAYADDLSSVGYEKLFSEADKSMYGCKMNMKGN